MFLLLLLPVLGSAQVDLEPLLYRTQKVAPLDTLVERALRNSPRLKAFEKQFEISQVQMHLAQKQLLRYINIAGTVNYGNANNLSSVDDGLLISENLSGVQSAGYRISASVVMPLSALISRNGDIKKERLNMERMFFEREQQAREIREEVQVRYAILRQAISLLNTQTQAAEGILLKYENAKEQFNLGKLKTDAFALAVEAYYRAMGEIDKVQISVETAFIALESFVGESIIIQ